MKEYTKVPLDRIAVIIGPNGEVKKFIEEKTFRILLKQKKTFIAYKEE